MEGGTEEIRRSLAPPPIPFFIVRDTAADISVAAPSTTRRAPACPPLLSSVFIVPSFRSLSARISRQIPNRQRRKAAMKRRKGRKEGTSYGAELRRVTC